MQENKMKLVPDSGEFERESRYIVIKISDVKKIAPIEQMALSRVCQSVNSVRSGLGKDKLKCVVIESDWPEYEIVWSMIEDRMTGKPLSAAPDVQQYPVDISDRYIYEVIQEVAELPDRNSPDDWPEAMLVTENELYQIMKSVHEHMPAVSPKSPNDSELLQKQLAIAVSALNEYADESEWNKSYMQEGGWELLYNSSARDGHGFEAAKQALQSIRDMKVGKV